MERYDVVSKIGEGVNTLYIILQVDVYNFMCLKLSCAQLGGISLLVSRVRVISVLPMNLILCYYGHDQAHFMLYIKYAVTYRRMKYYVTQSQT